MAVAQLDVAGVAVLLELGLDAPEEVLRDNRLVLAGVYLLLVPDFPDLQHVGEQVVEPALVDWQAAAPLSASRRPDLRPPVAPVEFGNDGQERAVFKVHLENLPDARRGDLVVDSLADDLPLKLGER